MTVPTPRPRALTQQQASALDFIRDCVSGHGYPPTVQELADHLGLPSKSSALHLLYVLEGRGYIARDPRQPRAITVLPPPALTLADRSDASVTVAAREALAAAVGEARWPDGALIDGLTTKVCYLIADALLAQRAALLVTLDSQANDGAR